MVANIEALDQRFVELKNICADVEGASTLVLPRTGDSRNATGSVHVRCTVARTRKPIAEPEESSLVLADQLRKLLDGFNRRARDRRGPIRTTRAKMRFEFAWCVGIFFEIGPVGLSLAEKTMHGPAPPCT